MRISKTTLYRGWVWSTGLGLIAAAVWASLDLQLKGLTGVSTADLQNLASGAQYRLAFHAWAPEPYAVRAGFNLGFDYLLMPLYGVNFFLSGIIAAEGFTPGRHPLRRYVILAAMAGAGGRAVERRPERAATGDAADRRQRQSGHPGLRPRQCHDLGGAAGHGASDRGFGGVVQAAQKRRGEGLKTPISACLTGKRLSA